MGILPIDRSPIYQKKYRRILYRYQYKHNALDARRYSGERHLSATINTPLYHPYTVASSHQNALMSTSNVNNLPFSMSQPRDLVSGECRPWVDLDKHDALTTVGACETECSPNLRWLDQEHMASLIELTTSQHTCTQMQQMQCIL